LEEEGRIVDIRLGGGRRWICADEEPWYRELLLLAGEQAESSVTHELSTTARQLIIKRFVDQRLSFTADALQQRYDLQEQEIEKVLRQWREDGSIEPAPFADEQVEEKLWISSKVAKQLIRYSIREYRQTIQPVPASRYLQLLMRNQQVLVNNK